MNCEHCDTPIPANSRFCLACGADLSDPGGGPRTRHTGQVLASRLSKALEGRYRITKLVGRGGMGAVFLAEDLTLERPVAIKVLPPEVSHDESLIGRFEREARTAAKLDHPNIVPIFSVESVDDLHFFVMKYVAGESLDNLLRAGTMTVDLASGYLWEAARALGHAHKRGVVHRDIKPANIMLDHDGRAMLADFGISKAMQAVTQHTGTGQVIGTPHYMSPEQAKGEAVDGRSDQYSLAVVGYQMLTGRLPFADDSVHTVIYKHIFEDPEPMRDLNPDVPPFLASAVHRALGKDPKDRFQSMDDFAAAIRPDRPIIRTTSAPVTADGARASAEFAAAPTEITGAPTHISITTGAPIRSRKRRRLGVMLAVFLIGTAGGGYWAWDAGLLRAAALPTSGAPFRWLGANPADASTDSALNGGGGPDQLAVVQDTTPADAGVGRLTAESPDSTSSGPSVDAGATNSEAPPPAPVRRQPTQIEAEPAAAPTTGRITVDSEPWGRVFIDGVYIKETPVVDHELPAGLHMIRIERDDCRPIIDTVRVFVGTTPARLKKFFVCGGN